MRPRLLAGVGVALVLAFAGSAVAGAGDSAARPALFQSPQAPATPRAPSQDNFARVTVNHFGNPALGQVNIETWLLVTYKAFRPAALTAQASAEKLAVARPAKRVTFRVELRSNTGLVGSSPTVNTGDTAAQRTVSGPTVTGLDADPPTGCFFFQIVYYSIRWQDNRLSSGLFLRVASEYQNDNC
jgi:hypothetical protein